MDKLIVGVVFTTVLLLFSGGAGAQQALQPGEAYLTRFSGVINDEGRSVIDTEGAVGSIIDLRYPDRPPQGQQWHDPPQRLPLTAAQVGQVFGITLDDQQPPNIYLSATSAFGLHRNTDNSDWMRGMWGSDGGPGTVWKLSASNHYAPQLFSNITLSERTNSGAGLGNIAYDRWNRQLYVSDLESGMIHRLSLADGRDLGHYDHGIQGRGNFFDATNDTRQSLPPLEFNPATRARIDDCAFGYFSRTPACWNFADFRRRVWGLGVRRDGANGEVRLYYSVWGSQAFGHPDWLSAGDEQRNSIWSIRIAEDGAFDDTSIRREFQLPNFFTHAADIARAGPSHPVTVIAFPQYGEQNIMVVAERGGIHNPGLGTGAPFSTPQESRVLRYRLDANGIWQAEGRYAVGHLRRQTEPRIRANATGGVAFGPGYTESGEIDPLNQNQYLWISGDSLCSADGPCFDPESGQHTDTRRTDGVQSTPANNFSETETTPEDTPHNVYMVGGNRIGTNIGAVTAYQPPPVADIPEGWMSPGWIPSDEWAPMDDWAPPPDWIPPPDWFPGDGWLPPPWWHWPLPPPLLLTDLAIAKTGPAECQEGVNCVYTITVTNNGPLFYAGPLFITDTMPEGATLAGGSAGWHCEVGGRTVTCRHIGGVALAPGGTVPLTLNIQLPIDVPGGSVQNCTDIHWDEMGTRDGHSGNDDACVTTPVGDGFDLGIGKSSTMAECRAGGLCLFEITITNHGPGEFNGSVAIRDTLPSGSTVTGPGPGWGCSQAGDIVNCHKDGINLPAAADTQLHLQIRLPADIATPDVENCAAIDWGDMGATDGDTDAHPDQACMTMPVVNTGFDLEIDKRGPAHCDPGAICEYSITVTNHGPDDYSDQMRFRDEYPAGTSPLAMPGHTGLCIIAPPNMVCPFGLVSIPAGETEDYSVRINIPDPFANAEITNCIEFGWGGGGMPADDIPADPHTDRSCVTIQISEGFDLEIDKDGPEECFEGGVCEYTLTLTNNGPRPYGNRFFSILDTLPDGAAVESSSAGWSCTPTGVANQIRCRGDTLAMVPSGDAFPKTVTLRVRLPDTVVGDTVENCSAIDWTAPDIPTGDDNAANDGPACHTTDILAADLAPFGGTVCKRGESCRLDVRLENRGGRRFHGKAGLRGSFSPTVKIESIKGLSSGLSCQITGSSAYQCLHNNLDLKPGAAAKLQLSIAIPMDFPHNRIIHHKDMLWPDSRVKDRKPGNDHHRSVITIEEIEPTPETPVVPLVCPRGWSEYPNASMVPGSWETKRMQQGKQHILCARPAPITQPIPCGRCEQRNIRTQQCERFIECHNGLLLDNECLCPKGTHPKATTCGYACKQITCPSGLYWNGRQCAKPIRACGKCEQRNPITRQCVRHIECNNGNLKRGRCYCPKGTRAKTTACGYTCAKIRCPSGQRWNGKLCVCPRGLIKKGRQCIQKSCGKCEQRNPKTMQCERQFECYGGKLRRGKCYCPKGTQSRRTSCGIACKKISCSGGRHWTGNTCACRKGLIWNGKRCIKKTPTCRGGRHWTGKACACRKGLSWNGKQCVKKARRCSGGRYWTGKSCICRKGLSWNGRKCVIRPIKFQRDNLR